MRSQVYQTFCNNSNNNLFSKVEQLSFQSSFFTSICDFQKWITFQASRNRLKVDDGLHKIAQKLHKLSSEIIQYLNYQSPTSKRLDPETRYSIYSSSFNMISQRYEVGKATQILKQIMILSPASSALQSSSFSQPSSPSTNEQSSNKLLEPSLFQSIKVNKNIICPVLEFILLLLQQVYSFVLKREIHSSQSWEILNSKLHALSIVFRQMIEPVISNSQFDGELIHNSLYYILKEGILLPLCQNQVLIYQEKKDQESSPFMKDVSSGLFEQIDDGKEDDNVNSPQLIDESHVKRQKVCETNTIGRCGLFKLNQWKQLWQILDLEENDFNSLIKESEGNSKTQLHKLSSSLVNEEGTQLAREMSTQTPSDSTSPLFSRGINSLRREKSSSTCLLSNRKCSSGILSQPITGNEVQNQNFYSSQGPIMSSFESIPDLCLSYSQTSNSQIISQRDAWYDNIGEDIKTLELKPKQSDPKQNIKKGKSRISPGKEKNNSEIREILNKLKNKRKQQDSLKCSNQNQVKEVRNDEITVKKPPKEYLTPIRKQFNKRSLKGNGTVKDQESKEDTFFEGTSPVFQKQTILQDQFLVSKIKSPRTILEIPDTPQNKKKKRMIGGLNKSRLRALF